ncbi:MAG: biotin--[acetyl-CoA-carboxylase] ligase [Gemmatimonadetes bacterium]|nr:biotin--[acetyl-CoA-carboxylase] ligase [Gemmatimonadota bacterium]
MSASQPVTPSHDWPTTVAAESWEGAHPDEWSRRLGLPRLCLYQRVGSTNDVLRELAEAGAAAGTMVIAEFQSAGRGRGGSAWHAPEGKALLFSVLLRPRQAAGQEFLPGTAPLRIGLAVAQGLEQAAGVSTRIKWPNDVLVEAGGKVAGILCEGAVGGPDGYLVAGIGINVAQQPADWPDSLRPRATSLWLATGQRVPRGRVLQEVGRRLLPLLTAAAGPLEPRELEEIARRDALVGRPIAIDGLARGRACGIAEDGTLRIREVQERETRVAAGTVRVLAASGAPQTSTSP